MKLLAWMRVGIVFLFPPALSAQFAFYDSINGIYWAQIEPPSVESFEKAQILREGLGYILSITGTLYEFDASRSRPWRRLPQPEPYTINRFVALGQDNVWAVAEVPEAYKEYFFQWDGKQWLRLPSPNVQNIRTLFFASPQEGWVGCAFGELWHYFHGQWQQETLPLFLHVNLLALANDGSLYASCEAPNQVALLKRERGEWQILPSLFDEEPQTIFFTPSNRLLIGKTTFSSRRLKAGKQTVWMAPVRSAQFFVDGLGYGVSDSTIYAFADTAYFPVAQYPAGLTQVCLFNERFSWIIGANGLILSLQRAPAALPPQPEHSFGFSEYDISRVYGIACLQQRSGKLSELYFVRTEASNSCYRLSDFSHPLLKNADHAPRLNLVAPEKYTNRFDTDAEPLTNYDQAVTTGDLNGDGLDDILIVSMYGHPLVYFNSGHEYYFDVTSYSGLQDWGYVEQRPMLANLFDADHDGDLDLFIACQFQSNAFFLNNGRGHFTLMTAPTGLSTEGGGIGGYVADFDGDGWEDLYVTRAGRPNILYRNLGPDSLTGIPFFEDASSASGDACWPSLKQSQGAAIADYDNDGDLDLFVCNLLENSRLLQNNGRGYFSDVTTEAGLFSRDQSVGATFFDADHDGDQDLIVANKGIDRFYKNAGNGTFIERSEFFGSHANLNLIMNTTRRFGGNSSGTLVFDLDDDADLDALIGNYDTGLFVYRNWMRNPGSAIEIFPEGIISNRSAVGAKVFLYRSGKNSQPDSLVGSRLIESANSYGCSPAKVAHFGVAPNETYNAKIIFPSGITREVRDLRGGKRRVVAELEGLAANMIKTKRALANFLFGYRSRQRLAVLGLGALFLGAVLWFGKKHLGLSAYDQKHLAIIFSASLLICLLLWFARTQVEFVMRPLLVSFSLTVLTIIVWRGRRLYQARPASIEMLQIRLNAFGHGSLIHQLMNRLALFAENLEPDKDLPMAARQKLAEAVSGLQHFLGNEMRAILSYQFGNNFAMDLAFRLKSAWEKLNKALPELQRQLASTEKLNHGKFVAAAALQKQLRAIIPEIQKQLSKSQRVEAATVIADFIHRNDLPYVQLQALSPLPPARITAEDLVYVLDELVQNALRQIDGRAVQIDIALCQHLDEVQIDVVDNGKGIPENLWEEIFRFGFTMRPGGKGGFGLYHARQRIEKYGGKIFVANSEIGKGTTMRICLKTVD